MNKALYIVLALALAMAPAAPALAQNPSGGKTELTTIISEIYTVTIPESTTISFNAASTPIGNIGLATARLQPGNQVTFTADVTSTGAGKLSQTGNDATLAYTLKIGGTATNTAGFTAVGTKTVAIDIAATAWATAPAGSYTDTITFTISCAAIPKT